MKSPQT
nr:unnamed protein product [Callosobruchus analis]